MQAVSPEGHGHALCGHSSCGVEKNNPSSFANPENLEKESSGDGSSEVDARTTIAGPYNSLQ